MRPHLLESLSVLIHEFGRLSREVRQPDRRRVGLLRAGQLGALDPSQRPVLSPARALLDPAANRLSLLVGQLAAQIRLRLLSAVELIELYLAQIARHNAVLNAIVILDESDKVVYTELVPEIGQEPDYDKALAAL